MTTSGLSIILRTTRGRIEEGLCLPDDITDSSIYTLQSKRKQIDSIVMFKTM